MEDKAAEKEDEVVEVEVGDGRRKSGRKVGRQAQIIAVPMWMADQSSVLE